MRSVEQILEFPRLFLKMRDDHNTGRQKLSYEYSEGYIWQATRNGPSIQYIEANGMANDCAVIYTTRGKRLSNATYTIAARSGSQQFDDSLIFTPKPDPDEEPQYVIIASTGCCNSYNITKVAKKLAKKSGKDVIVKNVGDDLESLLKHEGFEDYRDDETWDDYCKYDDNTFPQQVIDVKSCSKLEGSKYRRLRRELRRFKKEHKISIEPHNWFPGSLKLNRPQLEKLLERWAKQMSEKTGLEEKIFIESHELFIHGKQGYVIFDKGRMIGFMDFSKISDECLAMNVLISDFSYRDLCRKMIFEGVLHAKATGYKYLNIGGSENIGQYESKRVFKAEIEIPKKHLVWRKEQT